MLTRDGKKSSEANSPEAAAVFLKERATEAENRVLAMDQTLEQSYREVFF